ncbi:hypothetical protein ACLOJK_006166 [Asimina triloba]
MEISTPLFLSVLLLALPLLCFLLLKSRPPSKNFPPGPPALPIVGNLLQLGSKPHVHVADLARTFGPLFSLRFGSQPVIVASSPSAAAQVLKVHDRVLSGRYLVDVVKSKSYPELSMVWSDCTEEWKNLRRICRMELFGPKMMQAQAVVREQKVSELVGLLRRKEGEMVKLGELVFGTIFNVLGNLIFSADVIDLGSPTGDAAGLKSLICKLLEVGSATNLADHFPILGGLDLFGHRKACEEHREAVFESWKHLIKERRERYGEGGDLNPRHDFLDILIGDGFSDDRINVLLLELFSAASDTTTSTVEWAMAELIKNQTFMDKLRVELESVGNSNEGTLREAHLPHLSYLNACVKETLRLHPPTPLLLPRRALEPCQVMNYTIPKDCQVMVNAWAIGRDPGTWEDPLVFQPQRFLNSPVDYKGNDFELLPFGGGRRICPGIPLAGQLVLLILANLVLAFEWSLPNGMDPAELTMEEKFGLTLNKDPPLLVVPKVKS